MNNLMTCSNCGRRGHFFRECEEPITSLGILAFRRTSDNVQWLLIRRRDSLGFIEMMRGKYDVSDEEGIQALVDQMTVSERERFQRRGFEELWVELWNGPATRRYRAEFDQAKAKFEVLRSGGSTGSCPKRFAEYCAASTTHWREPEWGFPKGRRSTTESELDCALRETWEETGVKAENLHIYKEVPAIVEEFSGSNGIRYRHRYWLAEAPPDLEVHYNPADSHQQREVGDIRWVTTKEAFELIRPYNVEKKGVLIAGVKAFTNLTEKSPWTALAS